MEDMEYQLAIHRKNSKTSSGQTVLHSVELLTDAVKIHKQPRLMLGQRVIL